MKMQTYDNLDTHLASHGVVLTKPEKFSMRCDLGGGTNTMTKEEKQTGSSSANTPHPLLLLLLPPGPHYQHTPYRDKGSSRTSLSLHGQTPSPERGAEADRRHLMGKKKDFKKMHS